MISFTAEPAVISRGDKSSLRWSVTHATSVSIEPDMGSGLPVGDSRVVAPERTTTYTLTAANSAGQAQASLTVTVGNPPAQPSPAEQSEARLKVLNKQLKDLHFEYNGGGILPEEKPALEEDATLLADLFRLDPEASVAVEGYCDERGSDEYNMALGDRRANAVKEALVGLGVPEVKLNTISYGKEHPVCSNATEECYARNRRVHFSAAREKLSNEAAKVP